MTSPSENPFVTSEKCERLCTCGNRHEPPDIRFYFGDDACTVLASDCRKSVGSGRVLVIADENTHAVAGETVLKALDGESVSYRSLVLPGDTHLTEDIADNILQSESTGCPLIIAVGAGTMNDTGKYVADKRGLPYWTVPTAPSMNGYTSAIAAVKVDGVKRTLPSAPPKAVYVIPKVIREAPLKLIQSGFCDVMAKFVSDFDWRTESLLFSGKFCDLPSALVAEYEAGYAPFPEKVRAGDPDTINGLFKALLISGISMALAGSSAPASGGEHLVSHFWDMREDLTGRLPELHGLQVGAGVILSAACYRQLARLDVRALEKNRAEKRFEADAGRIDAIWGPMAEGVKKQFMNKRDRLLAFDRLLPTHWDALVQLFQRVREPEYFVGLFRKTGHEMSLGSLRLSEEAFRLAALNARTIRDRITVLDVAAHAGVLEAAAEEAAEIMAG